MEIVKGRYFCDFGISIYDFALSETHCCKSFKLRMPFSLELLLSPQKKFFLYYETLDNPKVTILVVNREGPSLQLPSN